jgi:hypothetical protein
MNGSPSIVVGAGRWNNAERRARLERSLIIVSVGVLAGVMVSLVRQPVHLPGHKVLWWMPLILAARLRTGMRGGATLGTISAICTTAMLGGRMPGGDLYFPVAVVSALLLDWCAEQLGRTRLRFVGYLFWFSIAGVVGNLLCMLSRVVGPEGHLGFEGSMSASAGAFASFAAFGIAAGAVGCVLGAQRRSDR